MKKKKNTQREGLLMVSERRLISFAVSKKQLEKRDGEILNGSDALERFARDTCKYLS